MAEITVYLPDEVELLALAGAFPDFPDLEKLRSGYAGSNNGLRAHAQVMIGDRVTVRITEAELARDIHDVLTSVRKGDEIIVEEGHRPVALIKTPTRGPGRKLSECIALAKAHEEQLGYAPVPDPDFAKDVQAAVDSRREPFTPPAWD